MNEPDRFLRSERATAAADLLRSATDDGPSEEVRSRIALSLGLPVEPSAAGAAARGAVRRPGGWTRGWFGKLAIGVAVIGGIAAVVWHVSRPGERPRMPAADTNSLATAQPSLAPIEVLTATGSPTQAAASESPPALSGASPTPSLPSSAKARSTVAPGASVRSLAEEVASLDRARATLASVGPAAALGELNRHEREFPGGALSLEAMVLRIDVLARSNRPAALALARGFLKAHPGSPYCARIRTLVPEAEP